ncbi:MAG TPA: M15 family metallopeptidase [Geminicoccus sp.]|nr:M15 family metallopeptidase [Geminicoccus sp.]
MSLGLFADDVTFHQRFLIAGGFDPGRVDGEWGPRTDAADQAFIAESGRLADTLGRFDPRSESNLLTLHLPVQRSARAFLRRVLDAGIDARIISGTRTYAEQDKLFRQGRFGNPGNIVTKARGGRSWHNFGVAWDIGIFDGGRYLGESPLYTRASQVGLDGILEWGGNWVSFVDRPHYQLLPGTIQVADTRELFEHGQAFEFA